MSPSAGVRAFRAQAAIISAARSSPGRTRGMSGIGVSVIIIVRLHHGQCHIVPSPACGGGTGRGHAEHIKPPLPNPPPPAGKGAGRNALLALKSSNPLRLAIACHAAADPRGEIESRIGLILPAKGIMMAHATDS